MCEGRVPHLIWTFCGTRKPTRRGCDGGSISVCAKFNSVYFARCIGTPRIGLTQGYARNLTVRLFQTPSYNGFATVRTAVRDLFVTVVSAPDVIRACQHVMMHTNEATTDHTSHPRTPRLFLATSVPEYYTECSILHYARSPTT